MTQLMAVTFERHGQLHYLRPEPGSQHRVGDWVLYPTSEGPEVAQVVWAPEPWHQGVPGEFPECGGPASPGDRARDQERRQLRAQARIAAKRLARSHQLALQVVAVDLTGDPPEQVAAIYYTADDRVDFRALVPDLARTLGLRVDMRHIGARDAAAVQGGIGSCGRELCCSTWLKKLEPVGLRLAKVQGLSHNPLQISGACGKLMCCLKYEHPLYADFNRRAPAIGDDVDTEQGSATVVGHSVPTDSVTVRYPDGQVQRCPLETVCPSSQARKNRVRDNTTQEP